MPFHAFVSYLELEKKYSPHTVKAYLKDLEAFSNFASETYEYETIIKVPYAVIRSWIVSMVDADISNRSINRKISSLKTYYKFLLKTEQISESPLAKHKALKTAKKLQVPFSKKEVDEVLKLLAAETDFEGVRNKLMVELFYATGMRRAELVQLKLTDVSIDNKTIKILGKRNKERIVPMLPFLISSLTKYLSERNKLEVIQDSDHLFLTSKGLKVYESLVYRVINSYFSRASEKVKKSPHILRHSFATHLLNEGADLNAVKELLGHASLSSTQVYTHNSMSQLKQVYQKAHPRNRK